MDCVKCEGTLGEMDVAGMRVDRCPACEGLWFDSHEVRQLVAALSKSGADEQTIPSQASPASRRLDDKAGTCPRCAVDLRRIESMAVEGLAYDQCMTCRGAWLDGGEIHQVVQAGEMLSFFNELD